MSKDEDEGRNSIWADLARRLRREPSVEPKERVGKAEGEPAKAQREPSFDQGDMPDAIQRRYYAQSSRWTGEPAYFSTPTAEKPAFRDRGDRLVTDIESKEVVKDLVTVAEHRGWDRIQVGGSETFRRAVWLEAAERGIGVRGFKPTERDLQELDRVRADKQRNSIAPVVERDKDSTALAPPKPSGPEFAPKPTGPEFAPDPASPVRTVPQQPEPNERTLPAPPEDRHKPSGEALDRALGIVAVRSGISSDDIRDVNRAYGNADWAYSYADHQDDRAKGRETVKHALETMESFAGKSRTHAEVASAIADTHYYDMALVGRWYVARADRDPSITRDLSDPARLKALEPKPSAELASPQRSNATTTNRGKKNERAAESQLRAIDVVVRKAITSPEAVDRVMRYAREQMADQLGTGKDIKPARVRATPQREAERPVGRQPDAARGRTASAPAAREHRPPERQRGR